MDNHAGIISTLLDWVWLLVLGVAGVFWKRLNSHDERITSHQIETAKTYMTKPEIHRAIQDAIEPIKSDTREIKTDVKQLLKNSGS